MELAFNAHLVFGEDLPVELPIASLEGYLFPDTYHFTEGQTEEELIGQMVSRFVQVTEDEIIPSPRGQRVHTARSGHTGVHRGAGDHGG